MTNHNSSLLPQFKLTAAAKALKLWWKMQSFLQILAKKHPDAKLLVDNIYLAIQQQQKSGNQLTTTEKYKLAFKELALTSPALTMLIQQTAAQLARQTKINSPNNIAADNNAVLNSTVNEPCITRHKLKLSS